MKVSPLAGKSAETSMLVNVPRLIASYYTEAPDPSVPEQRVAFGTSGHRGSPFQKTFNEWHVLAITHALCLYRTRQKIDGPLFLGMDTHALSVPALASALEVLAANGVEVMLWEGRIYPDARHLARDSDVQPWAQNGICRWHRDHPLA
jgi:phosphoglucomutase